ncbi:MAG TPA: lipopolysaccharide kinase InaA family protein [Thermodesulfobacteriota bacterium]|nr:lipopolysaccharide kinase InaA family protein [Thermodesulfobacteriota bacterium]
MGNTTLERLSKGEIRGWARGEVLNRLSPDFFEDPFSSLKEREGKVLKESKWRWAALLRLSDGRRVFFKRDKTKGWMEGIKYLISPSRGKREFLVASQSEAKGLPIPKPVGWAERVRKGWVIESYYFSEAIGTGVSFIEEVAKSKEPRSVIVLAAAVKKCQEAGLFHRDLHGGNFLWDGDSLFLTDLHRARIRGSLSLRQRLWNLSHLFHSLRSMWDEEDQLRFLDHYFEGRLDRSQEKEILHQKIHPVMDHLQQKQWRSRTKRCLKESTEFTVRKERGICYFHRRDFPLERVKRVMAEHQNVVRERPSSLAKYSPEVIVSLLKDEGEGVCLKQFCYLSFWSRVKENFRRSKGLKAWRGGNGMRARGFPSLKPLALVERKDWLGLRDSFLLMEAREDDQEMDRYILRGFGDLRKKRLFIKTFAHWLGGLHQMRLSHKDMKTCNILVSETRDAWNFHLLDFEDIRLDEDMNRKKLFRNFLQLNTSTPRVITKVDRYRFFREYLHLHPIVKNPKSFLRGLIEETRRRGLVYVSPHGVVTETME